MDFLSSSVAQLLQQLSLPLEMTGFGLVVLEVYTPDTVERIENAIDSARLWFSNMTRDFSIFPDQNRNDSKEELEDELYDVPITDLVKGFVSLVVLFLPCVIVAAIAGFMIDFLAGDDGPQKETFIFLLVFIGLVFLSVNFGTAILIGALVSLLALVLKLLDQMSGGHALASFGVLLAVTGLLMEIYQVAEMCIDPDLVCYGFL